MFDLSEFHEYREDNRREKKEPGEACRILCGVLIPHSRIVMAELLFLGFRKMKMTAGVQRDYKKRVNFGRISGMLSITRKR